MKAMTVKKPRKPMSSSSRSALARGWLPVSPPGLKIPMVLTSALDASGGQAGDDRALEEKHHDEGDRDDGARSHDGGVGLLVRLGAGEVRDGDGDRLGRRRGEL